MSLKNVMTMISVVTGLVGLGFIIIPTLITKQVFPNVGDEAIMVGVFHRQLMGALVLVFSIFHWMMRDAEAAIAKRFLFASGISFLLNALMILKVGVVDSVTSFPFPPFILLLILATVSFYFSKKEHSVPGK